MEVMPIHCAGAWEKKKKHGADGGEDRQEADELLPRRSTTEDMVQSAFDDRAAAIIRVKSCRRAQRGLDAEPHQPFIDGPLVMRCRRRRTRSESHRDMCRARTAA